MKRDKLIQTGKVLVTCTLTITGLGCHAGSGEDWADEANAMTTAEAQAFKQGLPVVTAWGVTFITSPRCGSRSMSIGSHSNSQLSRNGRYRKRAPSARAIPHPARTPLRCNGVRSTRESRARSKAFGAFLAIQSTARYCGVSRERRRRTPSPTRSCRRMSQRQWNVPLGNPQSALIGRVDRRYAIRLRARSLAHRVDDNNQQSRSTQASGFGTRRTGWATSRLNAGESCSTPALSTRRRHTHCADDTSRS